MKRLSEMPNIGITLERLLLTAGIETPEALVKLGSKTAFLQLKRIDPTACLNKLYALEGAVQGQRWHSLSKDIKQDLTCFFKAVKE